MDESVATVFAAALGAVLGAVTPTVIGLVAVRSQALTEIGGLYDQIVRYRAEHPGVLQTSRLWTKGDFKKVYGDGAPFDRDRAIYYGYVELCIGYANAVLSRRWLGRRPRFLHHHLDLVRLVMTENAPLIQELVAEESPYISRQIRSFWRDPGPSGWNWMDHHRRLVA